MIAAACCAYTLSYSSAAAAGCSSAGRQLWCHPELSYSPDLIKEPHTSLPSAILCEKAVGMFKVRLVCVCVCACVCVRRVIILLSSQTVQTFVSTKFNPLALDYHILSLQQLTSLCMVHPLLQDELYCQVIRQISSYYHYRSSLSLITAGMYVCTILSHHLIHTGMVPAISTAASVPSQASIVCMVFESILVSQVIM